MLHCNFERLIDRTPSTASTPTPVVRMLGEIWLGFVG
jgi:hypothetical protein